MNHSNFFSKNIIVILLGASEWPEVPEFKAENSLAFSNSAAALKEYLLSEENLKLPKENLCDLFDSDLSPNEIDIKIENFIQERCAASTEVGDGITDLLFYFIGHGGFTDDGTDEYFLAIKCTREANKKVSGLAIRGIARTLKSTARNLRRFIILDCCFSGSAFSAFQSGPTEIAIRQTLEAFEEKSNSELESSLEQGKFPNKGTVLLCSSRHNKPSRLTPDRSYTIFTKALINVLKEGDASIGELLSLQDLHRCLDDHLTAEYQGDAPKPELHVPDQIIGDISTIPIFPNHGFLSKKYSTKNDEYSKFKPLEDCIQCYVVVSASERDTHKNQSLSSLVRNALSTYKGRINEITGRDINCDPTVNKIEQIFSNSDNYQDTIIALCRAKVAIFDLTNYEPGVMLLLGIRSVVRRGITISSFGGDYVIGEPFDFPFNIKDVNIIAHSQKQIENQSFEEGDPIRLIGARLLEGFSQLVEFPNYLDLPSFDSVRRISSFRWDRSIKDYDEQILILCPFGKDYRNNNWKNHLRRSLGFALESRINKKPNLVRTLDMKSPRLVSQTLYEAIRLTSMCIVDWTEWNPNVFFELGVRLACNEIGPVCIIEDKFYNSVIVIPSQYKALLDFFAPIIYRVPKQGSGEDPDEEAFNRMVVRYETLVGKRKNSQNEFPDQELSPDFTYRIISEWVDATSELPSSPIHKDLINSANLLSSQEVDSEGRSPVLYPKNTNLMEMINSKAIELRLAAWYYMSNRYTTEQIVGDEALRSDYLLLGNVIASFLQRSFKDCDQQIAQQVRQRVKEIRSINYEG